MVLQDAQQLGLQLQRNVANFIQEQRAPMRKFHAPEFLADRAGESAFFMSEQFAFQQSGRDRGAIQLYKRAASAGTHAMNRARNQLLTCPGFPQD